MTRLNRLNRFGMICLTIKSCGGDAVMIFKKSETKELIEVVVDHLKEN